MARADSEESFCDPGQRHHQPDSVLLSQHARRRALLSLRRGDRSLHRRYQVNQSRLQVGQHSSQWPGADARAPYYLPMNRRITSGEAGSALIVVLSIIVTLTVTAAIAMEYTTTVRHHVQRSEALQSAVSVGDGALEHAFSVTGAKSVAATRMPRCITVLSRTFRFPPRLSFPVLRASRPNGRQPTSAGGSRRQFQTSKFSRSIRNCDWCPAVLRSFLRLANPP